MKVFFLPPTLLPLLVASCAITFCSAGFDQDVNGNLRRKNLISDFSKELNTKLMEKGVLLHEVKDGKRRLNENNNNNENNQKYSFNGYSLKYAKCQPIEYFSENALLAGETSPMLVDDIVLLRLCPDSSCSFRNEYGCHYNYAEYAVHLADYVSIMLEYEANKRDSLCGFCENCLQGGNNNQRRLNDADYEDVDEAQADENVNEDEENGDAQEEAVDEEVVEDEEDDMYGAACDDWNQVCSEYESICNGNDNYMNYDELQNYMGCTQINHNEYAFFVKPACEASSGKIKMAVYYDDYCEQYAGNGISIKNLGLNIREGVFEEFYSQYCFDCTDDSYSYSASTMCNAIHWNSAMCTDTLMYDLFEDNEDHSIECNFIESIRFGTYDEEGKVAMFSNSNSTLQVSATQKVMIALSCFICFLFIIYAYYLHHQMTNLLMKSLSHRELLPPGRRSKKVSQSRESKKLTADDDWD